MTLREVLAWLPAIVLGVFGAVFLVVALAQNGVSLFIALPVGLVLGWAGATYVGRCPFGDGGAD